jgi:ribonuclease HI
MPSELIYTDGACSKNGSKDATGGFGVFVAKTKIFSAPTRISRKGEIMFLEDVVFNVTNIRMEGLAIVSVLALYADALIVNVDGSKDPVTRLNSVDVFRTAGLSFKDGSTELARERGPNSQVIATDAIEIVTDSEFWINVIQKWMPGWIRKNVAFDKKNPDILLMVHYYTELLKQHGLQVIFTHVRSHQKGARTAHAGGNDIADRLATGAANNVSSNFEWKCTF